MTFLTLDEAAAKLRKSRRWLQSFLREHPYYRLAGRTKLFTEADINRPYEALPCPSNSSRRASRRFSRSGVHTSASTLTEALRLASEPLPRKSSSSGNARLNVVSLPNAASRPLPVRRQRI